MGVNSAGLVGTAKASVLRGSPKRLENHKTKTFQNFRWEGVQPVNLRRSRQPPSLLAVGVGGSLLGAQ